MTNFKYTKTIKHKGINLKKVRYGKWAIQVIEYGILSNKHLALLRQDLQKHFKKVKKFKLNLHPMLMEFIFPTQQEKPSSIKSPLKWFLIQKNFFSLSSLFLCPLNNCWKNLGLNFLDNSFDPTDAKQCHQQVAHPVNNSC